MRDGKGRYLMIQNYGVFKKPGDDSVHSHDLIYKECDTGDIVLYDHVKDQLEWRELTEKDRPKDSVDVYIWWYPDASPDIGCVSTGQVDQGHK